MARTSLLVFCICFINGILSYDLNDNKFPDDFLFGVATAAYQIEGAWNEGGKGENIWDNVCHRVPSPVVNNDTGDIACDSYHKYKEDVALLKDLGVDVYRFSLSWSRILPNGFDNKINVEGINYYKNLIRELLDNNIKPLVTIYHWDLPQVLQDAGGWESEFIIDAYLDYARVCFREFGDDVKYWLTFNEPKQTCHEGYASGGKAPLIISPGVGEYMCSRNLLLAHSKAWHLYNNEFRSKQQGRVGITIDSNWYEPASNSSEDLAASETALRFNYGCYADPVIHGDWPKQMKENIARRSKAQGYRRSRLPEFTEEEIKYMRNTVDFLGLNTYTSSVVRAIAQPDTTTLGLSEDTEVDEWQPEDWEGSASSWLKVAPWGARKLLKWLKYAYNDTPIMVTENGYSDEGTLNDERRINYYQGYISNIRDAMEKDDVNVIGYTAWSFMDNFEWLRGYSEHFGLYHVDFNSPNRTRTKKDSAIWYQNLMKTRCVAEKCKN
ncbi:myrosinase 1 [Leptinotarsa decemlineata]|uniref:myrosinase 1 n=1 Tax=Leptinotarsa decemlineata TaxID=7539 RepID=UPI003D3071B8